MLGIHELDAFTALQAQVSLITKKLDTAAVAPTPTPTPLTCNMAAVAAIGAIDHTGEGLTPEEVNFINFQRQNNPYSNTYNPGWRNHPNFSWSTPNSEVKQPFQAYQPPYKREPSLEEVVKQLVMIQGTMNTKVNSHEVSLKNIENQLDQISKQLSNQQ